VVNIQVKDFWVVTLCSDMVGYQLFRGPCCLHLQGNAVDQGPVSSSQLHS